MKGVFGLATPSDLFRKLEWEHDQLRARPNDAYVAYNFFVTAWHLLEWLYPDSAGKRHDRDAMRDREPLLQVCEHLAVGAKHLEPTSKKHTTVQASGSSGFWADSFWAKNFWADGFWAKALVVQLDGTAKTLFGATLSVAELAERVMAFWRSQPPFNAT